MSSIRVNYLYEEYDGDWSSMYNRGALKALEEFDTYPIDVTGCNEEEVIEHLRNAPACDVWYSFSIGDLILRPLKHCLGDEEPIIIHNHGGMETGDYEALLLGPFDTRVLPKLAKESRTHILFNSDVNLTDFICYYGEPANCTVVGFPVDTPKIYCKGIRRGIVVSGRPSIGKQVILAASILVPFRDQVTFCTGSSEYRDPKAVLTRAGFKVKQLHGDSYYKTLAENRIGFSATLADSFGLSAYEMVSMGMPVILPRLPVFRNFPESWKYSPYDVAEARVKVMQALEGLVAEPDWKSIYRDRFSVRVQNVVKEMARCM